MIENAVRNMEAQIIIMCLVLLLPFLSGRIEKQLELFLFVMGAASVTFAGRWSGSLIQEALTGPIKITLAVLAAGLIFSALRLKFDRWIYWFIRQFGLSSFIVLLITGLGLLSSVVTAVIAAIALAEAMSALKLPRTSEIRIVVIACFSIGLGAVLTPLGEPLATIATARLSGEPYHADIFFLARHLGFWVLPGIILLGLLGMWFQRSPEGHGASLKEDRPEGSRDILVRAGKVYVFVVALFLLGAGFSPLADRYLARLSPPVLYWINSVSAVLDNATLTAVEITPRMGISNIVFALMGLILAGGMLIPGNIPNIICAGKLKIKSREWAVIGVPLGLTLMVGYFLVLILI